MPLIDLKAHIQPSEGSGQWWKALNRSIHQPDLQDFTSPALTVKVVCGQESFSCWRFMIRNPVLNDLFSSPPCCVQEEKLIIFDNQYKLLAFMMFKQYMITGKVKISNTKVTSECASQLEDMISWVCPDINLSETSQSSKLDEGSMKLALKISGIESLESTDYMDEDDLVGMKVESLDESSNNNTTKDLNISCTKSENPKKLMKCHLCGWSKRYFPKHEWRFREHEKMCKEKFENEEGMFDDQKQEVKDELMTCILCLKTARNFSTLKNHMSIVHFKREIKERFVVPTGEVKNKVKNCSECNFKTSSLGSLLIHYGSAHNKLDEVAPEEVLSSMRTERKKKKSRKVGCSSSTPKSGFSNPFNNESDTSEVFKEEMEISGED